MARIPFISQEVGATGVPDLALQRPNQAFAQLGQEAAGAEKFLDALADRETAVEGGSKLADFMLSREERQAKMRTEAKSPDGFSELVQKDFDASADALLQQYGENPRMQAFLENRLQDMRVREVGGAIDFEAAARIGRAEIGAEETIGKYANIVARNPGQYDFALQSSIASIDAGGFPMQIADRLRAKAKEGLSDAAVSGLIQTNPYEARKQLKAGAWDDRGVNVAAKLTTADNEISRREADARAKAAAQQANTVAGLQVRINQFANGQADDVRQEEIDKLKPQLSPSAWAGLQQSFDDARARRASAAADGADVTAIIQSGAKIDPGNTKQVKALDAFFRTSVLPEIQAATAGLPEGQREGAQTARMLEFVRQQGVVPETMRAGVRTALRSGTPGQKAAAAQTVDQIKTVAPRALLDIDDETLRQANLIGAYVDGGAEPTQAVRMAEELMRQPAALNKDLEQQFDMLMKETPTAPWLSEKMGSFWSWGYPSVPLTVESQVRALERTEFVRNGGNLEAARRTAFDMVAKRYGPTTVNGEKIITRNPVEQHYSLPWLSPDQNAAAIKAEAVEDMSRGGATDGALSADRVRVLPYPSKGVVTSDGKPAYALEVQDSAGGWSVQMDEDPKSPTFGLPKPWVPSLAKEKAKRDEAVKAAIERAKNPGDYKLQAGDLGL